MIKLFVSFDITCKRPSSCSGFNTVCYYQMWQSFQIKPGRVLWDDPCIFKLPSGIVLRSVLLGGYHKRHSITDTQFEIASRSPWTHPLGAPGRCWYLRYFGLSHLTPSGNLWLCHSTTFGVRIVCIGSTDCQFNIGSLLTLTPAIVWIQIFPSGYTKSFCI